ncbi:MAG: cytochrome c biogenesis CcdA family protein [Candidatus Thorarchaeota archaeon]
MQGFLELALFLGGVFGSGLYIALSPCLFPLLPLFLLNSLQTTDSRGRALLVTMVLVAGIVSSLAVFAAIAGFIGGFILTNFTQIQALLGAFILFFGLIMVSDRLREALHLSRLALQSRPSKPSNLLHVYMVGLGYSLLAAPCTGPSIFAVILVFGTQANIGLLLLMFALLSVAVAIPYIAVALVTGEARTRMAMSMSSYARRVEIVAGVILILVAVILILPAFGIRFYL